MPNPWRLGCRYPAAIIELESHSLTTWSPRRPGADAYGLSPRCTDLYGRPAHSRGGLHRERPDHLGHGVGDTRHGGQGAGVLRRQAERGRLDGPDQRSDKWKVFRRVQPQEQLEVWRHPRRRRKFWGDEDLDEPCLRLASTWQAGRIYSGRPERPLSH